MSHSLASLFENALNDKKDCREGSRCTQARKDRMAFKARRLTLASILWRHYGALVEPINLAIVRMKASGKYQAITVKYFPSVAQP